MKVYLDSSVIVKRYVAEKGSESVGQIYERSDSKEVGICFSIWNIGETLGVIDHYRTRGWITESQNKSALSGLAGETLRLIRIEALEVLPVSSIALSESWDLVTRYHIYQADALQVVSCVQSKADVMLSADKKLLQVAKSEGLSSADVEDPHEVEELILNK